jgi:hypothetical protein
MADLTITAANVVAGAGATRNTGTAGETITAGQVVYLKAADAKLWLAQADGTAAEAEAVGIALHGALANQPLNYLASGALTIGATTAVGAVYVVSATAGGVAPYADLVATNRVTLLGYGTGTGGAVTVMLKATGAVLA